VARTPTVGHRGVAAQFAEVEVDIETGQVRVLRIVAAHDSGRIINPTLAESQLEGGIIQGLDTRCLKSGLPTNGSGFRSIRRCTTTRSR